MSRYKNNNRNYDQLLGKPGVVYILANKALAPNLYKIGATQRSGYLRAKQLNEEATTGIPAEYICIFECWSSDCGKSERLVHEKLDRFRRGKHGFKKDGGKWGQEFFEIDQILKAQTLITEICKNGNFNQELIIENPQAENKAIEIPEQKNRSTAVVPNNQTIDVQDRYYPSLGNNKLQSQAFGSRQSIPVLNRTGISKYIVLGGIVSFMLVRGVSDPKENSVVAQVQPIQAMSANSYNNKQTLSNTPVIYQTKKPIQSRLSLSSNAAQGVLPRVNKIQSEIPVAKNTKDVFRKEWIEQSIYGKVHRIAEIKGNRTIIAKQISESRKLADNSGYYGKYVNIEEAKPKCEIKAVMTNEEIKNCQN